VVDEGALSAAAACARAAEAHLLDELRLGLGQVDVVLLGHVALAAAVHLPEELAR
tara:strand:+ start:360 stop:524 length:165 start_codon:yes stop_codon:yes gene_type:complete